MSGDRSYPPAPPELPYPVTDNHTHIEPSQHFPAAPLTLSEQISAARAVGVSRMVQCGCDLAAARWTAEVAVLDPAVVGAIAIHPNDAARLVGSGGPVNKTASADAVLPPHLAGASRVDAAASQVDASEADASDAPTSQADASRETKAGRYAEALAEIARLAKGSPRIRAIGETGLDYYRTGPAGRPAQRAAFRDHIALAKELDLALQIHDRDAHEDVIKILIEDGAPARTVFHCFSGDWAMARIAREHGWYCSFAGTVTFKSGGELRKAVSELPPELILVETDAPYLTPDPFRGRPNAPYMVPLTMNVLAQRMGLELERACRQIQDNTNRVYGNW
ncbi:MAG: TatD family hydrolase [Bifidobacteriaceae bacterium]|jgi:TatD DNase family protein|nr:TatD family hydrolase [Bifidobacteriaceae bacterium]